MAALRILGWNLLQAHKLCVAELRGGLCSPRLGEILNTCKLALQVRDMMLQHFTPCTCNELITITAYNTESASALVGWVMDVVAMGNSLVFAEA